MAKRTDTKQRIIDAAILQFYRNGIHKVSFQQIADQVGITQAALYKHFFDKDDLVRACALAAAQASKSIIEECIPANGNAEEQLRGYLLGQFNWMVKRRQDAVIVSSLYYFAFNNTDIQRAMGAINNFSIQKIAVLLQKGKSQNIWRVRDVQATARLVHDLVTGQMFKALHAPEEQNVQDRIRNIWLAVESLVIFQPGSPLDSRIQHR